MIRIALCDDEPVILEEVSQRVGRYAEGKKDLSVKVFSFDSARALINALDDEKSFDVFVLDVYIGNEIGTELAKTIRRRRIPCYGNKKRSYQKDRYKRI